MTQMGFRPSCSVHLLRIDGKDRTNVLMHVSSVLAPSGSRENVITNSRQVRLATGIFPVVSLLNHSCSPNTSVSFTSTVATIRATQQIRKGQEIVHCYGPHESRMGVAERQKKLSSQYFFDCICPACHTETLRAAAEPKWEAFCCNTCRALMQVNLYSSQRLVLQLKGVTRRNLGHL
ncbi:SET and MYND domain-containing protein 4 isoform X2 [Cricetulus griseus]|uniref:SET and MYND domain-containing protein 4 isoform X2 n=1 Tax=Cricetulus griseus TaxID=10029 RepID=UPI000454B73A|nr:SET and MYND domain-containing protein 4 isoform X2 [Cricetulus griseus]